VISGSGNVAQFAAEKALHLGAKVLTLSDSQGYVIDSDGIVANKLAYLMDLTQEDSYHLSAKTKNICNGRFAKKHGIRKAIRDHVRNHVTMGETIDISEVSPIISDIIAFNDSVSIAQEEVRAALQRLSQ
jgi:hypothetical protein